MKKVLVIAAVLIMFACLLGAATLTTRVSSYRTLDAIADVNASADTDLAAATGYFTATGAPTGAIDLLKNVGVGSDTFANKVSIIVHVTDGADGDTVTQKIYGIAEQGPPQLIASVVWTIGLAQVDATSTNLWADDAAVTSTHIKTITEADGSGSDRVCSVTFDVTGYRYLYGRWTADTGAPTIVTALYRHF